MSQPSEVPELSDDIEIVSPGQMLAQAREAKGFSQQQVAEKLNFRQTLVKEIEADIFDQSLPATFNRGYLKNYAKLVDVDVDDVLASYETLNIAQKHGAELQSFSKETEKQAENSRLMWVSYIILALLIGSSVIWWVQDAQQSQAVSAVAPVSKNNTTPVESETSDDNTQVVAQSDTQEVATSLDELAVLEQEKTATLSETLVDTPAHEKVDSALATEVKQSEVATSSELAEPASNQVLSQSSLLQTENDQDTRVPEQGEVIDFGPVESAQFTFSGDCWVNIYDATGERIAWGIKKTDYVMNITGQAPFRVTLGKPELVSITYQQQVIDMSQFNRGNIAKFTLPLDAES